MSPHQYSKRGGGGLASDEKVIFVLRLLGPILPVHFHRLYRKKYLRRWDKSHQRASSGPLRANATKGRNPLHFQCDQILQFLIYVLKNLMVTSSTSIHIDGRHSRERLTFRSLVPEAGSQESDLAWEAFLELEFHLVPKHAAGAKVPPHSVHAPSNFLAKLA